VRLTTRGVGLLATGVVLLLGAALVGVQELYAVALAAAVLVAGAAGWVRWSRPELRTSRALAPARVPAGGEVHVELAVHNEGRRCSAVVALRDRIDDGRSSVTLALAPLAPGASARTSYRIPCPVRGVFEVGPLEVELADPFGLVSTSRPGAEPSPLVVHPRLVDLRAPERATGTELDAAGTWAAARATGGELATIREYRTGDDLRRVHWPSTARLAELMVRQDEAPVEGRLTVAVDLRQQAWAGGGLELALSVAASVLVTALGQGVEARLVTSAGKATPFGLGPDQRAQILDLLAAARPARSAGQAARLISACTAGPTVLVTAADEAGWQMAASASVTGRSLTTVLVRPERGGAPPVAAGPRTLVVDSLEALVRQWRTDPEARW
jgi:uncharacterized protein (DUF58 family)